MNVTNFINWYEKNLERIKKKWFEFLRFKSISTDPHYSQECKNCALWLGDFLREHFFKVKIIETAGNPVVIGFLPSSERAKTILVYGHYDVQPVVPLEAWKYPPFDPVIENGKVYARGAQDNKGQLFYVLAGIIAMKELGRTMPNIIAVIEGEEECGSYSLTQMVDSIKEELKSDLLFVTDALMAGEDLPCITMGLRGLIHMAFEVTGPPYDLHSGSHGGLCMNPAEVCARLIASLKLEDGRIAIDEFYRDIEPISDEERRLAAEGVMDEYTYEKRIGIKPCGGERDKPLWERLGFRPSLDINGVYAGYTQKGIKTIIPSKAVVKLTARFPAGPDPHRLLELLECHLKKNCPSGVKLDITEKGVSGNALRLYLGSTVIKTAQKILRDIYSRSPVFRWEGASIPVIPLLKEASGGECLIVGFGLEEDRAHAPNENFSLERFRKGFIFTVTFLEEYSSS